MAKLTYADVKAAGTPYDAMIREAADANGVDYDYLHKKIFNESSFDPNAKSPTGPRGLGQFTKATGRAYGLMTDEDFFDPQKSINASAAYTKDLLGTYKGDYLKAALAYNQGNGRLGAPQLAALDRGDFSKISAEGNQYMANLLDVGVVGKSPLRKYFDQPNAPKRSADLDEFTQGVSVTPKIQRGNINGPQSFDLALGEAPQTQSTFREMELRQNGPDKDLFDGTWDTVKASLATSVPAQILRNITVEEHDPLDWVKTEDTSDWTDEDFENIRKEGVDPKYFSFIFDNTRGHKSRLGEAIKLAKENMEYDRTISSSGLGAQLTGGLAGAALDPLTYVPVPGTAGASFAARVGKQAVFSSGMSVASEGLRSQATGIEAHYAAAAVGGAVVGGVAAAALDRFIAKAATAPQGRPEMPDGDLEAVLARHGEASQPNTEVPLPEGMEPTVKQPREDAQDDDYLEKILGMHGERHTRQEGLKDLPDDTIEGILARHQESSEPNEFFGTQVRLQGREAARASGQEDPTRLPWNSDDIPETHEGVDYVPYPAERNAVRLRDGSIISGSNPLNPQTLKMVASLEPQRSARGFTVGDITEIGYTLNRTEDPEILDIGNKLFRSTVQTESGSNGRFGATASDVVERLRGEDHVNYGKLNDLTEKLLNEDPAYAGRQGSRDSLTERAYRRVAEAIEDQTKLKMAKLSKQERELMDLINEHFKRKQDVLENPAQFGNSASQSLLDSTRHQGHYVPNVYDDAAKALFIKKFGGADGLQEGIRESWLASYAARPHVRQRVDKMVKESLEKEGKVVTPEMLKEAVQRYAHDKAFGIAHTADFNRSALIDDGLDSLVGAENNNFLEARNLFDSDIPVTLTDGSTFSVNDLRVYDFAKLMPSYDRRINGDVGIMAATGEGTDALKAKILSIQTKQGNTKEVAALEDAVKLLTGRARRSPDSTFGTALRILNDLSFATKNAYMAAQNFTEVAGMVTNGHLRMLMHGVPYLREMTTWGSKISPENLKEMHGLIFGRELDDTIRPRRQDIVDRLRQTGSSAFGAELVGSLKYGSQELAARSPFTKLLTETSNYIIDSGRQGALLDLVNAAHGAEAKIFTPDRLRMLSITPQQFGAMKQAIKQHLVPDGKGFKIKDPAALRADPRTMDIWRLGDKVADESLLRPHKLSSQDTKALGAGWHMALQFKKFVLRSLNARLMRGIYDSTKNGRGIDFAIQSVVATGLATSFYVAQRYVQAQGMPQEARKDFLKNSFTPEMLGWAAMSRNNIIGSPIGVANFIAAPLGYDPAAAVRTSVLPRGPEFTPKDRPVRYSPLRSDGVQQPLSRVLEQVPGAGILGSVYQVGANAEGLWGSSRNSQELGYMTGLYNGLRGLVPNDPVSQRALSALMQEQGMEYRKR